MKRWYIVHVISGKEDIIKEKIEKKITAESAEELFGDILVPTEEIMEIKLGKQEQIQRKFFPGYLILEMNMSYKSWFLVKYTLDVIGFIGGNAGNPVPVSQKEIDLIIEKIKISYIKPKHKKSFERGELVRVIDGPFADFTGVVEDINYSKNKLCICISIFGRSTPIDLNFNQVEKT
jgi:transcriptional antiterminator NusG